MRIAHISDIHVRNYKYHYEYREVFQQLFDKLEELKPDIIVNTGDTAHTKCNLSPEYFNLTSWLFTSLAKIAPLHMILGNHDCNVKNSSRLDAVSPLVDALEDPNIHFHKYTQEVPLADGLVLNVLSILDQDKWGAPSDSEKTNIALYHGAVAGSKTDTGWIMEHGEIDLDFLENFDYGLLGDIHRTNQIVDDYGKARYPGSLIQQNFGESLNKGFLLWDIKDKTNFTCDFHELKNPKPFVTINLTPKGGIPMGLSPPAGARLRLVSSNNQSIEIFRKAVDIAKKRFKPESISFLNRAHGGERISVEKEVGYVVHENLRDQSVQEKLIAEYLKEYNVDEKTLNEVYSLNAKYNALAEDSEDTTRNVSWKIKNFKWDNLFNYGEDNELDFTKLAGTVGIFGKNYSGKSSVVDSLLYTIFNNTSKNIRKNYNVINEHKDYGAGVVEIEVGNKTYKISRRSDKYVKKLKGISTNEAKTDVEFSCTDNVLNRTYNFNSTERHGTDKNIKKIFGSLEDFLMTSMSSQLGSMQFINEGSTRRKEILAKFLDLEFFEKKFKLAKDESAALKGALRRLEEKEYDEEVSTARKDIFNNEADTLKKKGICDKIKKKVESSKTAIAGLEKKIAAVPADPIDIEKSLSEKKDKAELVSWLETTSKELKEEIKLNNSFLKRTNSFLKDFDLAALKNKLEIEAEKQKQLEKLLSETALKDQTLNSYEKQQCVLKGIPCGDNYLTSCRFIKDAYKTSQEIEPTKKIISELKIKKKEVNKEIIKLDTSKVRLHIQSYEELTKKKERAQTENAAHELDIQKNLNKISEYKNDIVEHQKKIDYYNENKEAIENYNELAKEKKEQEQSAQNLNEGLVSCENETYELAVKHGALAQKLENIEEQKQELADLQVEFAATDLFLRCMHSNGIAFDIINKALPVVNEEISKVLVNIVDFEVYFEKDGNKLDIFIHHPNHEPRPLENGSGAEKTLAAIAIRIALLNISNMPKSNLIILDEPGAALDEEHLESFARILDMLKSYFDIVILITHIESLKDVVDMTIDITKKNSFAYVNQ
jgi:DNA repair exonuclease SbcCD ATPase subunit/DNA repair exonuclease SbcCD nuclease subunit